MVQQRQHRIRPAARQRALLFPAVVGVKHRKFIRQQLEKGRREFMFAVELIQLRMGSLRFAEPGVERRGVHLAAFKIHHPQPQRIRLEPEIDVLADEDDDLPLLMQAVCDPQNPVVRGIQLQFAAENRIDLAGRLFVLHFRRRQHEQPAGQRRIDALERHSFFQPAGFGQLQLPQPVEVADHLPGVAPEFVGVLLELVQLLHHGHRNDHVIVLKRLDALRAVQQHIGIEHKCLNRHLPPPSK